MNWRMPLSMLLLAAAVAASWLLVQQPLPQDLTRAEGQESESETGYYALHATVIGTQKNGDKLYELNARKILHYPHDNSVTLHDVHLRYHPEGNVPWTLQSDSGRLPGGTDVIELSGNVRVVSHPDDESDQVVVTTTRLDIFPEEDLATTEAAVDIRKGSHTLAGIGMKAYLKEERLELLSNVYGRFSQ